MQHVMGRMRHLNREHSDVFGAIAWRCLLLGRLGLCDVPALVTWSAVQVGALLPMLKRGVGVHHSGLLPILKEVIEILFQENLIKACSSCLTPTVS